MFDRHSRWQMPTLIQDSPFQLCEQNSRRFSVPRKIVTVIQQITVLTQDMDLARKEDRGGKDEKPTNDYCRISIGTAFVHSSFGGSTGK